jgi:hypothetical protein
MAAAIALGPASYPERGDDLALLRRVVASSARESEVGLWSAACFALGRSGDEGAREALLSLRDALGEGAEAEPSLTMLSAGLVAAGDWEAADRVIAAGPSRIPGLAPSWLPEAYAHRHEVGDPAATERILGIWRDPAFAATGDVRLRLAIRLFLHDELRPADLPVEEMLKDLESADRGPEEAVAARAVRLRRGEEGAKDRLLAYVRRLSAAPAREHPGAAPALVQAARGLLLYGR